MGVKGYLRENEETIRKGLKNYKSNARFSVSGLTRSRKSLNKKIKTTNNIDNSIARNLHKNYKSLNKSRVSIIDPLEKFRTRFAFMNLVQNTCSNSSINKSQTLWNTIYMPQHEIEFGKLDNISPTRVKNKVDRAIGKLINNEYPSAKAAGFVEVQVTEFDGYQYFSPHIHFITWGIPKEIIKSSIKVRRLKDVRSRMTLEHTVKLLTTFDVMRVAYYVTKFKAELNHTYNNEGDIGRADDPMPEEPYAEWLHWMSSYKANGLMFLKGFDRSVRYTFCNASITSIIDEFIANNKPYTQIY